MTSYTILLSKRVDRAVASRDALIKEQKDVVLIKEYRIHELVAENLRLQGQVRQLQGQADAAKNEV